MLYRRGKELEARMASASQAARRLTRALFFPIVAGPASIGDWLHPPSSQPYVGDILLETGDRLLTEASDKLLLE